ncbi:MAG: hypothetical protein IIX12_03545, partial [Alistipes sp.]|nr:hypothetical protein [Alistipes sp.]
QSAIGLPFVKQKTYGGKEVSVTEYTLSEIVDSVYRADCPAGFLWILRSLSGANGHLIKKEARPLQASLADRASFLITSFGGNERLRE